MIWAYLQSLSLAAWLIVVPGICYALAAGLYLKQANWPLAIVYSGYSFSNVGLLWLDRLLAKQT